MSSRRLVLAAALAAVAVLVVLSVAPPASVAAGDPAGRVAALQADDTPAVSTAAAQCIPCSPKKPCLNPLTICTYSNPNHGCCLGYAGQN